jgi:hypothetical protein
MRRAGAGVAAVLSALAACSLSAPFTDDDPPPGWEQLDVADVVVTGPVERYRPGTLITTGRLNGRECLLELAVEGVDLGDGPTTARCLPAGDRPPRIPSATAVSSNGDVILAVEWQDMADATPPAVWAGRGRDLSRQSLAPGPDADATAFVDAATSEDQALVVGTTPSAACPHGAVAGWAVGAQGLSRFGTDGPCVDAGSRSSLHASAGDRWMLVAGPAFAPGAGPSAGEPTQAWYATAADADWATAAWHRVVLPVAPDLVSDVVGTADGMVAGSRGDRPVLITVSRDRATEVEVPDEPLDPEAPTVLVADPGAGSRPVVLAVQARSGVRLWTQRRDGWYAVAGPPGHLASAVELEGATWLATRGDDGEVTLWVRRRTPTDTSPPAYRAQR